ncbi:MAG: HgcAB-associated protein [Candidatus Firestonebacteria bacterium]
MVRKRNIKSCSTGCCCKVEAMATIDERGQLVLPKDLRNKAKIKPGDKLAVVNWEEDGKVCCIALIKEEYLAQMAKSFLGPMFKEENKGGDKK